MSKVETVGARRQPSVKKDNRMLDYVRERRKRRLSVRACKEGM